jgi:hypothetical protein
MPTDSQTTENPWLDAIAAANPDDDGSLARELGVRGLDGSMRRSVERLWSADYRPLGPRRSRYVQGWRPE